jgi:hypothetical protein
MLNLLWWLFSPTYRHWHSAKSSYKQIGRIMGREGITRSQAIALAAQSVKPELRVLVTQWRDPPPFNPGTGGYLP